MKRGDLIKEIEKQTEEALKRWGLSHNPFMKTPPPEHVRREVFTDREQEMERLIRAVLTNPINILVFGITQDIIQPSQEAAYIYFDIKPDAPPGQTDLTITNLDATDLEGQDLDVLGNDGSVTVEVPIPTLSEWGMIILITLLLVVAIIVLKKRKEIRL